MARLDKVSDSTALLKVSGQVVADLNRHLDNGTSINREESPFKVQLDRSSKGKTYNKNQIQQFQNLVVSRKVTASMRVELQTTQKKNNKPVLITIGSITRPEIKANMGDVAEGVFAAALAARFFDRTTPLISADSVYSVLNKLSVKSNDSSEGQKQGLKLRLPDLPAPFYVDGRLYFHLVANESNLKAGIQEIRPIDASKIRKVKEVKHKKDPVTGAKIVEKVNEFYIYQEKPGGQQSGVKLTNDSVSYVTSGILDESRRKVVGFLHKALKPITQLRMIEDSLVIYRLARAPERRMFYIDVGNLPRGKAEQYMKDIMAKYRNKLVYDAKTGEIRDDRKHMSMLEDFWLPRREGGRGTEVSSLPGGENLGQIEDVIYFQKRLYRSLNVPMNRLEQEQQFSLGRATEISRDELKFQKFIDRVRNRFAHLFYDILKKQLIMKNIITEADWQSWKNNERISQY